MYLLKSLSIAHHPIFHALYRFFLTLQMPCSVVLLSFSLSYANEQGATVLTVPVATENFPDGQEALETSLHHETGLKEPRVYKDSALKWFKNAMQLIPSWLKSHYGTLPLSSVRAESATQVQLSQYSLSQAIELIESDTCQDDVSFRIVFDKKIANTLKACNQLPSLPFQGTIKFSINLLEHESFLYSLNYEEKEVPITFAISFNLWQKMFKHHASVEKIKRHKDKKTKRQLSLMHKKFQSTSDKISLTLPNHITFLDVSKKHHVEHLHQNTVNVSSIIIQTHGQQKVVLMPPISEQRPHHHCLDLTGQFFLNKEIDLSASDSVLNNERRLTHATLYSIHLNPGDILLVPANWFIYRKSITTSVSMSLNYLSGNQWRLFCSQAEPMEQKHEHNHEYLTQEKRAVTEWMSMEMQQKPYNKYNIMHACKSIQAAISDATQPVLDLSCLKLSSLPDAIFRIPHLKTLHLTFNKLTSLSLSDMDNLVSLDLAYNLLTSFSLSHMKNLVSLNLGCNQLTSFSLDHMKNLASLHMPFNQLTSLSLSHVNNLVSLDLQSNQLISCSLSSINNPILLNLADNQLTSFSFDHVENFMALDLARNQLASFSLNHVNNIGFLRLAHNQLTSFSLNQVKSIISLDLQDNQLTSFSLSHIKNLVSLNLSNNQLRNFLCCNLSSVNHINLRYNRLAHLDPKCISSINTHQIITLDLRNNPWSIETITQIQQDLLQRSGDNITYYPILYPLIKHINNKSIKYKDFIDLLSRHNLFLSSEHSDWICPITHHTPHKVIFFMTSNKCYIMYDADALIQWIHFQSQLKTCNKEIQAPSTREPLTFKNLIGAEESCILQHFKKELKPVATENMGLILDHKN